ncbi:MAG: C10 family peptidase [Tannerella sp.]|jgi:hypothetical protein|nr:C10 family peptidase [Tannerella sp.]
MKFKNASIVHLFRISVYLWLILYGTTIIAKAEPIDEEEVRTIALTQFRKLNKNLSLRSSKSPDITYKVKLNNEQIAFYVVSNDDGFVVVSGDQRFNPVLGYSTGQSFDPENIPPAMIAFLEGYKAEMLYIVDNDIKCEDDNLKKEWHNLKNGIIPSDNENGLKAETILESDSPKTRSGAKYTLGQYLLKTKWGQREPYNDKCPFYAASKRCATGCVATSMAQIMCYWSYPDKGFGYNAYMPQNLPAEYTDSLFADFASTNYYYNNMPEQISTGSSQNEIAAVSTLMYHCGISVNMNYNASSGGGSGAETFSYSLTRGCSYDAFREYWGYKDVKVAMRTNYTNQEWLRIIKSQIDNLRPVLYKANSSSYSAHSFICDGYDEHNRLHMNWGWKGDFNSFFHLTALYADGTNYGGYNQSSHVAIIDIYPTSPDFVMPPRVNSNLGMEEYIKDLIPEDQEDVLLNKISVYPLLLSPREILTIETPNSGEASIWNSAGHLIETYKLTENKNQILAPELSDYYIIKIKMGTEKNKTVHIKVK